jgi:hypothetical protein
VNDRRGRGLFRSMVSILDILSGAVPLMVDVRQTGGSPIGALTGDLQGLSTVNFLNATSWTSTFQRDISSLGTAVGLVRHDLGLPPATPVG